MRLGDDAINHSNHSHRHAAALRATFTAFSAVSSSSQPEGRLVLGDRGDGSATDSASARSRYAHINDGHVPDFIRYGARHHCYEYKCYTPFLAAQALGLGSRECGGAASTADGGSFAFGNTEEALRAIVLGVAERGRPADGPLDRRTGLGWVAATSDHQYADAQRRGNPVTLLHTESTGALAPTFAALLRVIGRQSRASGSHDSTRYGVSRSSPSTFYAHHSAAISHAIVSADATVLLDSAASINYRLAHGLSVR